MRVRHVVVSPAFGHRGWRRGSAAMLACLVTAGLLVAGRAGRSASAAALPPVGWSSAPSLPAGFTPRWDFASAYFPPADQVVLFGGGPAGLTDGWYNDTWVLQAGVWTKSPAPPAGLAPRGGASMAYDPVSQRLVMFGGAGPNEWPPSNQTWLWDGTSWSAGPSAPAAMAGRTGAGMAYLPEIGQVVLFGGTGVLPYNDTWFYDGATGTWSAGPSTPSSVLARAFFGMAYDPVLHRIAVVGGDGTSSSWLFDGATWTAGPAMASGMFNNARERTQLAYDPQIQADVLFSGLGLGAPSNNIYYLPSMAPTMWKYMPEDTTQPGLTPPSARLEGGAVWLPTADALFLFAGVSATASGTFGFADASYFREVPPRAASASLSKLSPLQTEALKLTVGTVTGGYWSTTRAIRWLKNDEVLPKATGTKLSPQYHPGDRIQAQVQYTDKLGVAGPWVSTAVATVAAAKLTVTSGSPGQAVPTTGKGFGKSEQVDLRLDSPTSPVARTLTSSLQGAWGTGQTLPLPAPLVGGGHVLYATGRTTGTTASASFQVLPTGSLAPIKLASGDVATFTGDGFASGELVSIAFPGGDPVTFGADVDGHVAGTVAAPPMPNPGGNLLVSASSGTISVPYSTIGVLSVSGKAAPGSIPVSGSGWGSTETVNVTLDGGAQQEFVSDGQGSLTGVVTLPATWGSHSLTGTGSSSGLTVSEGVSLMPSADAVPSSGPKGTVVTLQSGAGWVPGSVITLTWANDVPLDVTVAADGTVTATYQIPAHPTGLTYFHLTDPASGADAKAAFNITSGSANLTIGNASPGMIVPTTGSGFMANESVELRLDGPTGTLLRTITTSPSGAWGAGKTVTLPNPLTGGPHTLSAVGLTSSNSAAADFTVVPGVSLSRTNLYAGENTIVSGAGFAPEEAVAVSFPSGLRMDLVADAAGSVSVTLACPPQPQPGGVVTAAAASGSATAPFTVESVLDVQLPARPGDTVMTLTGWGPSEEVTFGTEGATQTLVTDSNGSLSAVVTAVAPWGPHTITVQGASSGLSMSKTVNWDAWMQVAPASGPKGTVVEIRSGPGWSPGSTVTLTWAGDPPVALTADAAGVVDTTYTIPSHPLGLTYFNLSDPALGATTKADFTIVSGPATLTAANGAPGTTVATTGAGFAASEPVDIRLDGPAGTILRTITAGPSGTWGAGQTVALPTPLPGGFHSLYGVGTTSGKMASATFQVLPGTSLNPAKIAAGETTAFKGVGFAPGEPVDVAFPGALVQTLTADGTGTVSASLVAPAEPYPSGVLMATAPSGSAPVPFTVQGVMAVMGSATPGHIVLSFSGWGAGEPVNVSLEGGLQQFVMDDTGSLRDTLTLITTWGSHTITASGATSGMTMTTKVNFTASMHIDPSSGPKGTTVTVDSGPGWWPGSTLNLVWASKAPVPLTADPLGVVHTTYTITNHPAGVTYFTLSDSVLGQSTRDPFTVTSGAVAASVPGSLQVSTSSSTSPAEPRAAAAGQITAQDGKFWLGGQPILLHGVNASPIEHTYMTQADFQTIASWNMNFVRLRVHWSDIETQPPVFNGTTWVHTYDAADIQALKDAITWASQSGLHVLVENALYVNYPDWLFTSLYNSHGKVYPDGNALTTDFWSDALMQQFMGDYLRYLASQLKPVTGIAGYEPIDEPNLGTLPVTPDNENTALTVELNMARKVRDADPARMIFFTTHDSLGAGLATLDLTAFQSLGNVAYDVHDYFGGRWGAGMNLDPADPDYGHAMGTLLNFTLNPDTPAYLGTTLTQTRFTQYYLNFLLPRGIPLFIGEFGGKEESEPNMVTLMGTDTSAFNSRGVSWTAWTFETLRNSDGSPQPWLQVLTSAAAYTG